MKNKNSLPRTYWFIVLMVPIILLNSCLLKKESNSTSQFIYSLDKTDDLILFLDSEVTQQTNYIQYLEGQSKIAFFNKPMHNICIYSTETGLVEQKISLFKEGPHAINDITAFYRHNSDSTYIYHHWRNAITLVNDKSEIVEIIELPDFKAMKKDRVSFPTIYPTSYAPFRLVNDSSFILSGMYGQMAKGTSFKNYSPICIFNYRTNTADYTCTYPSVYGSEGSGGGWGVFTYQIPSYTIDDKSNMVISFFADDSISVYNIPTRIHSRHYAGSSKKGSIKQLPKDATKADFIHHAIAQTQNCCIFYDRYNKLYYRLIVHSKADYDINDITTQMQDEFSVVILNEDFEKIGECFSIDKLPLPFASSFVSPKGLHIRKMSDDDDQMRFVTFKPAKL